MSQTLGPMTPGGGNGDRWYSDEAYASASVTNGSGTVYYVDGTSGSDSNNGLSEGGAWKTIQHALDQSLGAGATVRIKAGTYREFLYTDNDGTVGSRITIGAHGDGNVIIDMSTAVASWSLQSGQIYYGSVAFNVQNVVVDEVALMPAASVGAMTAGTFYYDSGAARVYVWCPSGGSPSSYDVGVIEEEDDLGDPEIYGLRLDGDYTTLYGVTVRFNGGRGVTVTGEHVRLELCRVIFNGKQGTTSESSMRGNGTYTELVKCEFYHNVCSNWPYGRRHQWGGWEAGVGVADYGLFEGNISHKNGGEGLLSYLSTDVTWRDNIVYDNFSVNIYCDNLPNGLIERNFVYSHDPDPDEIDPNADPEADVFRRMRPVGIMTADEDYGSGANLEYTTIRNNIVVNCRKGIHHYPSAAGSGLIHHTVVHNTVVMPVPIQDESYPHQMYGIGIPYCSGNNTASVYKNNIVYAPSGASQSPMLFSEDVPSGGDQFPGLSIENNAWHHDGNASPFRWGDWTDGDIDWTHTEWVNLQGTNGANDVTADPLLVATGIVDDANDARTQAGSPCRNAGADLDVSDDWNQAARDDTPTIGAWED